MVAEKIAPELLERALARDRASLQALLQQLAPIIQARAARVLARRNFALARDARQELLDMTQEVFLSLLEDDARALRAWREERGMSFENFVGLVAERQVVSILRTARRSPWKEEQTSDDDLEEHMGTHDPQSRLALSRDLLRALLDRLREELSPRMLQLFYAFWVDETPVPDICAQMDMQPEAVYAARSRIAKRSRLIAAELEREVSDLERKERIPR